MVTLLSAAAPCPPEQLQPQAWVCRAAEELGREWWGWGKHPVLSQEQTRVAPNRRTPSPGHTAPSLKCQMQCYSFKGATRACANTHTHAYAHAHTQTDTRAISYLGVNLGVPALTRKKSGRSQAGGGEEGCQPLPQLCSVR